MTFKQVAEGNRWQLDGNLTIFVSSLNIKWIQMVITCLNVKYCQLVFYCFNLV
jgi:hypothetical protein